MKKLAFLLIGLFSFQALAQRTFIEPGHNPAFNRQLPESKSIAPDKDELEIIYPGNWQNADSIIIYTADTGGYATGNNGYNDLAKAQLFLVEQPYLLHGAYFSVAVLNGLSGQVHFRVWDFLSPDVDILANKTLTVSQIRAMNWEDEDIYVAFDQPLLIERDYLLGIELSGLGTSDIALWSTMDGRGGRLELAWEQWENRSWHSFLDPGGWNMDIDLGIFPMVEQTLLQDGINIKQVVQRTDGSGKIDVTYDFNDEAGQYYMDLELSLDGGSQFTLVNPAYVSGDVWPVSPGNNRQLVLDASLAAPDASTHSARLRLSARTGVIVTTAPPTAIASNSARIEGAVVSGGGYTVSGRGIAYGTSPNPLITGQRQQSGSGTGSFTADISGLQANTTYYARAYATIIQGTFYGNQVSFKTLPEGPPAVNGPAGSRILLPPEAAALISNIQISEVPAANILKPGEQAASPAMRININGQRMIGSTGDYEIRIPLSQTDLDPARLRLNVKVENGIILPVPGRFESETNTYVVKTFGLAHEWELGVASGNPMTAVASPKSAPGNDTGLKQTAADWPSLDFWILDDSEYPRPLTEYMISQHILPVARDALITLQSSGFAAPLLRQDDEGRFHMILIDREKIAGLGSASYYEPPTQQLLGRLFINYPPYISNYATPSTWRLKNVIIHESFHAVQWGYRFEHHPYNAAFAGNQLAWASSAYLEGTASLIGANYQARSSIGAGTVVVDDDFPAHNLGYGVDDFAVSNPYSKQDFFAFVAKRYLNGSLLYLNDLFRDIQSFAPEKMDQPTINYLAKLRKGLNKTLTTHARPLPEVYTEYAMQRLYLHESDYLLRSHENPASDSWFTRNLLAQSLLTEGSSFKKWFSKKEDQFDHEALGFSGIRPLSAVAAIMYPPSKANPDLVPDSLKFSISLTGGGRITNIMQEEGIKMLIIRAANEFGTPVEENPIVYVNKIDKPVSVSIEDGTSHLVFLIINSYVDEIVAGININPVVDECLLDPMLFGLWVFTDSEGVVSSYHFREDGTLTTRLAGQEYQWYWCVEGGRLKLFVPNGIPAYMTYKIEGNQLFFYVESVGMWGLPFTKQ